MSSFIKDWTQKEVDLLTASFKRYRVFVLSLRFLLPIAAAGILFMIVFFAENEDKSAKLTIENVVAEKEKIKPEQITSKGIMQRPRFQGVDASNQPYSLIAETAWQENENQIGMQQITADITLKSGSWISLVASEGMYFLSENQAVLNGIVEVFIAGKDNSSIQIQTSQSILDIKNAIATSDTAITVKSDLADFSASGFTADRDAQTINFKGPIKLVILQE